jgi:hypothetical protein
MDATSLFLSNPLLAATPLKPTVTLVQPTCDLAAGTITVTLKHLNTIV